MNFKLVFRVVGLLCILEGIAMLLSLGVGWVSDGRDLPAFALSAGICFLVGAPLLILLPQSPANLTRREGFLVVSLVWIVVSLLGSLPFLISREIPGVVDAFFESVSGFTTTGSTVLDDIERQSKGMLFWRALTQWLGGIGIILLTLSFLKQFGIGGMQLFDAEVPGPTHDRVNERIQNTARQIWGIYFILTVLAAMLLKIGGMTLFDSLCHALSTMASSGFSTKQAGLAYWNSSYIHYVTIFFMIIAGTSFSLFFFIIKGNFTKLWQNEEYRYYLFFIFFFTVLIFGGLLVTSAMPAGKAFEESLFTVVSLISTTGYVSSDFSTWPALLILPVFGLYFFGGMAGSTGGGMKIIRIVILLKNSWYELRKIIHPSALIQVRFNKRLVDQRIVTNILAFFAFYILIFAISSLVMMVFEPDFQTAIGAVAACLANIGPGLGAVGPAHTYSHIHDIGKIFLSFLMLLGRLEFFTMLVILTPSYWRE